MASLVNHSVTNLINGVSQQASSVRLDNQVEEQINCFSDVTKGLTIRNGLELINVVDTDLSNRIPIEFSLDGRKYYLGLDVSDTGNELIHVPLSADVEQLAATVTDPEYFSNATKNDIVIVEDKDKVYILNKKKVVGTNESNSAYYDISIKDDDTGLPATTWSSGSYRLTITSVIDDASSLTPSASPMDVDITSGMSVKDIADLINANTALTDETGVVDIVGDKGSYRLYFKDIPVDFTVPEVTLTSLTPISGTTTSIRYEPRDATHIPENVIEGEFAYNEYVFSMIYYTFNNSTKITFANGGGLDRDSIIVKGKVTSATYNGWTYYRGNLMESRTNILYPYYLYSVRREKSVTSSNTYTPTITTPTTLTGDVYSADKFADKGMIWITGVASEQSYNVTIEYEDTSGTPYTLALPQVNVGTAASQIKLNWVAEEIRQEIDASTHFTSTTSDIFNNAIYFYSTNSGEYTIKSIKVDNNFDTTSINAVVRATIDNDSGIISTDNLPPTFKDGFKIRIGDDSNEGSNYYLYYDEGFQGWKEVGLDESRALDENTMPYIIDKDFIRTENSIEIKPNTWAKALSGDRESNKSPSFVERSINDIFFYGSRLGVATDDTLVLSSIGKSNEFFRTTTSTTLESDRVDIQLDNSRIGFSAISNVIAFESSLLVNTGYTQSNLLVNSSFDLTKARLSEVSSYTLGEFKPLPVNNGLYFALSNDGRTNIYNYISLGNNRFEAYNLTKHLPYYIKGNIKNMVYADNVTVVQTDTEENVLYVQNRYSSGGEMLQNAWHRWEVPYEVLYMYVSNNAIHIMFKAEDQSENIKTFICKYDITPQVIEEDTENAYIGWVPYLDCYTKDKTLIEDFDGFVGINDKYGTRYTSVSEAYDSTLVNQETLGTETPPTYSNVSPVYYWQVDGNTNRIIFNDGTEILSGNSNATYFDYGGYRYFKGEESEDAGFFEVSRSAITTESYHTDDIVYGIPFKATVVLSEIVPRQQNQDGSFVVMNYATLMLRRMRLYLGNSGVFRVTVDFQDRQDYNMVYTGKPLGKIILGRNNVSDINFNFPINGKSDKIEITITTESSMPFNLLSAEWQGKLTQRGRNI